MSSLSRKSNLKKKDYELLAEFRRTLRLYLGFSEQAARAHGLKPQQYQALLAIEGFPGRSWVTVGELASHLQIAHHSAVGLVDRLEVIDFVKRAPSKQDRRKVTVSLTRKGQTVLEKLFRVHRAELRTVGPQLSSLLLKAAQQIPEESGGAS